MQCLLESLTYISCSINPTQKRAGICTTGHEGMALKLQEHVANTLVKAYLGKTALCTSCLERVFPPQTQGTVGLTPSLLSSLS